MISGLFLVGPDSSTPPDEQSAGQICAMVQVWCKSRGFFGFRGSDVGERVTKAAWCESGSRDAVGRVDVQSLGPRATTKLQPALPLFGLVGQEALLDMRLRSTTKLQAALPLFGHVWTGGTRGLSLGHATEASIGNLFGVGLFEGGGLTWVAFLVPRCEATKPLSCQPTAATLIRLPRWISAEELLFLGPAAPLQLQARENDECNRHKPP